MDSPLPGITMEQMAKVAVGLIAPIGGIVTSFMIRDIVGIIAMFIVVGISFLNFNFTAKLVIDLILYTVVAFTAAANFRNSDIREAAFAFPVMGVLSCFYLLVLS